jgi:hypothetical protein
MLGYLRKNPLLAGCVGLLGCLGLVVVFLVSAAGLGLHALTSNSAIAVMDAKNAAASEGFSFGYVYDNGDVSLDLMPFEPREVTCDQLWELIEPHILRPEEPLTLRSQTAVYGPGGDMTIIPLECSRVSEESPELEEVPPSPQEVPADKKSADPAASTADPAGPGPSSASDSPF